MLNVATRPRAFGSVIGDIVEPGKVPAREPWDINPTLNGARAPGAGAYRGPTLGGTGLVATPEQEAESERVAAMMRTRPDYAAILRSALGERPKMNTLQTIAAVVGPALMAATGNQAGANAMSQQIWSRGREWDERARDADLLAVKWGREDAIAERERNKPQILSGSSDQVRYDPATGTSTRIYDAPEDFETYAAAQGLEPGSDGYFDAVEDYVLRGNGPTAFKYDRDIATLKAIQAKQLEAERQRGRAGLESLRQTGRLALRQTPPARANGGKGVVTVATPAEAMKLPSGTKFRGPDGVTRVRP